MRLALVVATALVLAFAIATWWALEADGVAAIETHSSDGTIRSTHVWYVEPNGELMLEAGSPENGWFKDVQHNPLLSFSVNGTSARYIARPIAGAPAHERIRSLIREKYGWRDWWVGLIVDTSRSIAVELSPMKE